MESRKNRQTTAKAITDHDIYLFREGSHFQLYDKLGAHLDIRDQKPGVRFAVWAPNAKYMSVIGNFNDWNPQSHPLVARPDSSGIWEGFIEGLENGKLYKYHLVSSNGYTVDKGDPYSTLWELPPNTASIIWDLEYTWNDADWMAQRKTPDTQPMSVYEVHLGSWKRDPQSPGGFMNYRQIAHELCSYVKDMGFTHVELLPVMEHPFYGSWGYQTVGYFAPTCRYGNCQDFMYLVDHLHQNGIGVILDWVPSHFPTDEYGLGYFDGTHLYEHADPRLGFHPDWKSNIFNYGRNEVRSFLISSAMFWLDKYHIDALRVDAVASMLYLDYSRKQGEWIPNRKGGRENLEAIDFLRRLNEQIHQEFPHALTIAEESTSWPMVTRSAQAGGLGFDIKWNMGWMHDSLEYFSSDCVYRQYLQEKLTFPIWYAFNENFMLPLSHDEIVYGKGSLYEKMPGDPWQKFANLRLLFGYMFTSPGRKLLFMGGEFAQDREWDHDSQLKWELLDQEPNAQMRSWVCDVNRFYQNTPSLYETDYDSDGFEWIDFHDHEQSIISFIRKRKDGSRPVVIVCNFTPVPRYNYRVGVPCEGIWKERLNSDAKEFGGSGHGNMGSVEAAPASFYGRFDFTIHLTLPPLAILILEPE